MTTGRLRLLQINAQHPRPTLAPPSPHPLCQADQALQLWQLPHCSGATSLPTALEAQSSTDGGEQVAADEPRQLLLLKPKQPQCNLRCSALAPDSQWMVRPQCREGKARAASQARIKSRSSGCLAWPVPAEAWGSLALRAGRSLRLRFLVINPPPSSSRLAPTRRRASTRLPSRPTRRPASSLTRRRALFACSACLCPRRCALYYLVSPLTPLPEEVRLASCTLWSLQPCVI